MAFRFSDLARSRMAIASACCFSVLRLLRLGQSILATVDTQAARNSRGAGGGRSPFGAAPATDEGRGAAAPAAGTTGVLEQPSSSTANPPAMQAAKVSRFFALKTKTI